MVGIKAKAVMLWILWWEYSDIWGYSLFLSAGGFEIMKKPMMTEELFYKIKDILKEKGKLPDILDYGIATGERIDGFEDL